jgi:hypothetical protein
MFENTIGDIMQRKSLFILDNYSELSWFLVWLLIFEHNFVSFLEHPNNAAM